MLNFSALINLFSALGTAQTAISASSRSDDGLSSWCCSSPAQCKEDNQATKEPSFQLKVQSNLVIVRVVVRDAKGQPVRGLKKEDFKVFDQGKGNQSITQLEEQSSNEYLSGSATAVPSHETELPTAHRERFIALYFDNLNSSDADLMLARDAADHFLATGIQPNDRVAIFSAEKMLSDFTSDPHQFHAALMQLHSSTLGSPREHSCPDLSDYQAFEILQTNDPESEAWKVALAESKTCPLRSFASSQDPGASHPDPDSVVAIGLLAQKIVDRTQSLTRATFEQLGQVVRLISRAPGERSVVLVSPGFLTQSDQHPLDRIIDQALRSQVVINSLDPRGLSVLMRESDASKNTRSIADPRAAQARYHLDASRAFAGADVLAEFAEGTGGNFFHSDNDLRAGLGALVGDLPHYILAFFSSKREVGRQIPCSKSLVGNKAERRKRSGTSRLFRSREQVQHRAGCKCGEPRGLTGNTAEQPNKGIDNRGTNRCRRPGPQRVDASQPAPCAPSRRYRSEEQEKTRRRWRDFPRTPNFLISAKAEIVSLWTSWSQSPRRPLMAGRTQTSQNNLPRWNSSNDIDSDRISYLVLTDLPGLQSSVAIRSLRLILPHSSNHPFLQAPLPSMPGVEEQIPVAQIGGYAKRYISKLPDFFATRNVIQFADSRKARSLRSSLHINRCT